MTKKQGVSNHNSLGLNQAKLGLTQVGGERPIRSLSNKDSSDLERKPPVMRKFVAHL
ncbi:MAG: hypothetical protein OXC80_04125 [Gammaproteobacteria bacterium]|nr:hypothetical protein [Gammaproteobacteria bacterium]